jgi:hypothetical protein
MLVAPALKYALVVAVGLKTSVTLEEVFNQELLLTLSQSN